MDAARQKLMDREKEPNTRSFPALEMQERTHEACADYLVEAKVDVDRLLRGYYAANVLDPDGYNVEICYKPWLYE